MLQNGRILVVGDLSKDEPESVVTGYRASPVRSNHPRWNHYLFSVAGRRTEFRLYGVSDENNVAEAAAPNRIPPAWAGSHDYEIGDAKFSPSVLISGDGVVFVNEDYLGIAEAAETSSRVKKIAPRIYGHFLMRQNNGWFYALENPDDVSHGRIARFRTEIPSAANQIDYLDAWVDLKSTFLVGSRLDVLSVPPMSLSASKIVMGSGDTSPVGALRNTRLFVTKTGRLAVNWNLFAEMDRAGRLNALSETARSAYQKLESGLRELYG